jgi:hypothetical protein
MPRENATAKATRLLTDARVQILRVEPRSELLLGFAGWLEAGNESHHGGAEGVRLTRQEPDRNANLTRPLVGRELRDAHPVLGVRRGRCRGCQSAKRAEAREQEDDHSSHRRFLLARGASTLFALQRQAQPHNVGVIGGPVFLSGAARGLTTSQLPSPPRPNGTDGQGG